MSNLIFDIQRFSIHDGPGIRTTVFFKGCNLRCAWCHNPESISPEPVLQLYRHKCIHCGLCGKVCPQQCITQQEGAQVFQRELCTACGECTKVCYAECRQLAGKEANAAEILATVEKDLPFYKRSGGGVTFSGGEPMLQPDFLLELLKGAAELKVHTAVDTAGNVPFAWFEQVRPYVGVFLYDLKIMRDDLHKKYTGVSNERIIGNLTRLADGRNDIHIRIPVMPDINDNEENMNQAAELISSLKGIKRVELLPFHPLGEAKYQSLDMIYPAAEFGRLATGRTEELSKVFRALGF